jgi:hypothetical protein
VTLTSNEAITQTVTVTATKASLAEEKEGGDVANLIFTRTGSGTLTAYFTVGGTATAGSDYYSLGTSVTFGTYTTQVVKTVYPLDDTLQEPTETILVTLVETQNYAVGTPGSATVTLTSNETVTQTVTVTATHVAATEAGPTTGRFTFTRTGNTAAPLTAYFTVGGTATPGSDYGSLGTSVAFPAGVTTITKLVTPVDDTLQEPTETIIVTLVETQKYAVGGPGSATVNIFSNDTITQTVTVAATDASAGEAAGYPGGGAFTFTRTGNTAAALTAYFTVGGTATAGSDYVSLGTSVAFGAGVTHVVKILAPREDTIQEWGETVILTLAQSPNYAVGTPGSATVSLGSNDDITQTVTVTATDAYADEAGLGPAAFTFTRKPWTGNTAAPLTVYFTVGGTATAGSDYQGIGTSVAFGAGVTKVTKKVIPLDDTLQEPTETIIVTLLETQKYAVGPWPVEGPPTAGRSATVRLRSNE